MDPAVEARLVIEFRKLPWGADPRPYYCKALTSTSCPRCKEDGTGGFLCEWHQKFERWLELANRGEVR